MEKPNPFKPIVHYDAAKGYQIGEICAFVYPVDHPSDLVSNTRFVQTSPVIRHDKETGEFETRNTIYRPI